MNRNNLLVVSLVVVIVVTLVVRYIILGGVTTVIGLDKAAPLVGVISQSLDAVGGKATLPVAGKDFTLNNTHYFDNNSWVVTSISPVNKNGSFQGGLVILQKVNNTFKVVLGPGTAFDKSYLQSLPADVGQYLTKEGVIRESVYQ